MTLPQSNPLIEYGLRRVVELTRGIKATERENARFEERVLAGKVEVESRLTEREDIANALQELGLEQSYVENLMDSTAAEYDAEWAERTARPVRKAVPEGMRPE